MEEKYVCKRCRYPTSSPSIFREIFSPYGEFLECPNCKSTDIVSEDGSLFHRGWQIIRKNGSDIRLRGMGTYIQLSKTGEKKHNDGQGLNDTPQDVVAEINERRPKIEKIIRESGVTPELTKEGIQINHHIETSRSH